MDQLFDDGLSKGLAPGQLPAAASSINCRCFLTYSIERLEKQKEVEEPEPAKEKEQAKPKEPEKPKEQPEVAEKPKTMVAATIKEAEEYAKNITGVEKVKFTGMEVDVINEFNGEFEKTMKVFPQLKGFINALGTTTAKRSYAYYAIKSIQTTGLNLKMHSNINFSKVLNKDLKEMAKNIADDVKRNFHFKSFTPKHLVSHEMAHAIENYIEFKQNGWDNTQELNVITWNKHANNIRLGLVAKSITNEALENMGIKPIGRDAYNITKELGHYAATHKSELFAQAICDAVSSENPLEFSKEVLRITKERLKE